jgi:hypothetical protein
MGLCFTKPVEECTICEQLYNDLDDTLSDLPMMSPVLIRQRGYMDLKRARHISINEIYKIELDKMNRNE